MTFAFPELSYPGNKGVIQIANMLRPFADLRGVSYADMYGTFSIAHCAN